MYLGMVRVPATKVTGAKEDPITQQNAYYLAPGSKVQKAAKQPNSAVFFFVRTVSSIIFSTGERGFNRNIPGCNLLGRFRNRCCSFCAYYLREVL